MEEKVTIDTILDWFREATENKEPISPGRYLDGAHKLNVLLEDIDNELIAIRMILNQAKAKLIEEGKKVSQADVIIEANPAYGDYLRLEAKRARVNGFIQIAKKRTELKEWE